MLVVPFGSMRSLEAPQYDENKDEKTGAFQTKHSGRVGTGSIIYAQEGCTACHSQLTRPTYAGQDVFREGQGGFKSDPDRGDTRRITNYTDFVGEDMANIGETRIGGDLGNFGRRMDVMANEANAKLAEELKIDVDQLGNKAFNKELYVLKHLFNPRADTEETNCPKNSRFFKKVGDYGQGAVNAVANVDGFQYIPNDRGNAVTSYLLNLKRDGEVPMHMRYKR